MGYGNKTVHATGRPSIPGNSELPLTTPLKALIQISRKFIYLNLDANECLERIKQRRRSEEDRKIQLSEYVSKRLYEKPNEAETFQYMPSVIMRTSFHILLQ